MAERKGKKSTFRRMMTTKKLRGTRKKFMIVARVSSGIYLPLRVPKQGKYRPQQISKIKNPKRIIVVSFL